jgi:hypothetical protein
MVVGHLLDGDSIASERDDKPHLPGQTNCELTLSIPAQRV